MLRLIIDIRKIQDNYRMIRKTCEEQGLELAVATGPFGRERDLVQALTD